MYKLDAFTLTDMLTCGADIRQFGRDSASVEEASEKVVRYLFNNLITDACERATVLVRLFKTLRFDELDDELKSHARATFDDVYRSKYLTLMASAGKSRSWNDRLHSNHDRLIPVVDSQDLHCQLPMVAQLLAQLEGHTPAPDVDSCVMEPDQKRFNVFYVPEAAGSPFILDQTMVQEHGVRSVIGYGGMLHRGSAYCVVIYANVVIPRDCADLFHPLALSTKNALIHAPDFRQMVPRKQLA